MDELTEEQETISRAEDPLMAVTAYAGTGKTSTLRAYARRRPHDNMLYLAFNKALSDEAKIAFRDCPNVKVRTLHSLAFAEVGRNYSRTLGNFRVLDLNHYFPGLGRKETIGASRILFELLNAWMISSEPNIDAFLRKNSAKVNEHLEEFGVSRKKVAAALKESWEDMVSGRFTMTHNGYFKLFQLSNPTLPYYTYLLVDEAQDLNAAMLSVILGAKGKKILVGDPYQQIYGWNGAVNALGKASKMGAAPYYLTRSFRCPEHVSLAANMYLTLLGAKKMFKGRGDGQALGGGHKCPRIVIGRTNAAIFDFAANNMKERKIFYNGGFDGYQFDMLKDLNHLRSGNNELIRDNFIKRFSDYAELESYASTAQDGVMQVRIEVEKKYQSFVHEIYDTMRKTQMGDEREADVVITTAHKVKGQEYDNVTLLKDFASLPDVLEKVERAENNKHFPKVRISREEFQLVYVAITRSFNILNIPQVYYLDQDDVDLFKQLVRKKRIIFE